MRNLKIAFICFSYSLGGLELSALRLAAQFMKRMANVLIVTSPNSPLTQKAVENQMQIVQLGQKFKYLDIMCAKNLARLLKSHETQVVVVMQSKDLNLLAITKFFLPELKIVFYQEMQSSINKKDPFHSWVYSKLNKWITLTEKMKQETLKHTRVHAEKIQALPIGSDLAKFNPALYDKVSSRKLFGLPLDKIVVGTLGRLDPQKGQEEFIRAIPDIIKEVKNVYFVITGDETVGLNGYKKHLIELCNSMGINEYVQFVPFTDLVPEFLSAIDIFVLPSHNETFGFVLVEAMAMGKAIVATNAGGVPEIISDKNNGVLIPPKDAKILAKTILNLVNDEQFRYSISNNAKLEASKKFDIEKTTEKLIEIIESL